MVSAHRLSETGKRTTKRAPLSRSSRDLDRNAALMALDDGPRDGESQAAMLAELLAVRAQRLEAAEHLLARFLGHAGAFVLHLHDQLIAIALQRKPRSARHRARRTRHSRSDSRTRVPAGRLRPSRPASRRSGGRSGSGCRARRRVASRWSSRAPIIAPTSTSSNLARLSCASSREASEMSVISRSSRCTSSRTIASSRSCNSGSLTELSPSTAERSEARGFFIS